MSYGHQQQKKITKGAVIAIAATALGVIAAVAGFLTWLLFMETVTVEPGHEAVLVDKPYFVGHEGVRDEPLREGRLLIFKTTGHYTVRMTPQSIPIPVDDYSSKDNILLDFETTIQYRIVDSVNLIEKFGEGWFDNNIKRQYLAIVRDAVKKKTMTEMMSDVNTAADVDNEVTKGLHQLVKDSKLPIDIIGVSLGRAKPNANVLAQMNETAAQQQRTKTLVEATTAENKREEEQRAKARADNAYRNAIGLTPEQFVQLESIRAWSNACLKAASCIVTSGQNQTLNVR